MSVAREVRQSILRLTLPRVNKLYGKARWRKRKGQAEVLLPDGTICRAEIHWYEATGIGRRELKIKELLD